MMQNEEFLCKPVCVDLPMWYPELLDWGFALPTCQAPLSTLIVKALGHRLGVLLRWMLAKCRHTPPLSKAFKNTVRWICVLASVFSLSTFNKVGK